jgi:hypothetical protein
MPAIKCEFCSYICSSAQNMKTHSKVHQKCNNCDYVSNSRKDIKKHYKEVHGIETEVKRLLFFRVECVEFNLT